MVSLNDQLTLMDEIQILTFTLDDVLYGVNVNQVREVKHFEGITRIPYAPDYIKGVTNIRGEIVPVIDLRKRFGLTIKEDDDVTNILIIVHGTRPVGIMVDSVLEVLTIPQKNIQADSDSLIVDNSQVVLGIAKCEKDLFVLLDFMKVVAKNELNGIVTSKQLETQNELKS